MAKKKPSLREDSDLRCYLTAEQHLKFLRRMREEGFTSQSAYVRSLIMKDFKK